MADSEKHVSADNFAEISRVALDLFSRVQGMNNVDFRQNPEEAQKRLLAYRECFKAVVGDPFDITKLT